MNTKTAVQGALGLLLAASARRRGRPSPARACAITSTRTRRAARPASSTSSCSARRAPRSWLILTDLNPPSAPEQARAGRTGPPGRFDRRRDPAQLRLPGRHGVDVRQARIRPRGAHPAHGGREELSRAARRSRLAATRCSPRIATASATELGRGRAKMERGWEKFAVVAAGPALTVLFNDAEAVRSEGPEARHRQDGPRGRRTGRGLVRRVRDRVRATPREALTPAPLESAKRKRPPSTRRTTAGLIGLRSASIEIVPVTPAKSFVAASASRMRLPSVDPARAIASAISRIAS